jgi:CBS domain-containing protein
MDAAHVMTLDVTCVDEDTPISMAWDLMQQMRVRHLPVVDQGRLVGIVSDRDLLERVGRGVDGRLKFPELCVAEVMSFEPISCSADAEIAELAATMLERRIDAVPIVSPQGALVGLVTSTDLLRLLAQQVEVKPRPLSVATGTYR